LKGVSNLVSAILITIIVIGAISLVLNMGTPAIDRSKEILLYKEGKNNLKLVDNSIKQVLEGEGSTRSLSLSITDGNYYVHENNDTIMFVMNSASQIVGIDVSKTEDGVNITGKPGIIYFSIDYDNIDVVGGVIFGKGSHSLKIKNQGYDSVSEKQIINITV
jgi:hypothetical protein